MLSHPIHTTQQFEYEQLKTAWCCLLFGDRDSDIDHRSIFILHILVVNPQLLFELVCYEGLVLFQTSLDVHLELDDIVEHAHRLRVELLAECVGSERELLIPNVNLSVYLVISLQEA